MYYSELLYKYFENNSRTFENDYVGITRLFSYKIILNLYKIKNK